MLQFHRLPCTILITLCLLHFLGPWLVWAGTANVLLSSRGTFGRQASKPNGTGNSNQQKAPGSQTSSPTIAYGPAMPPPMPPLSTSASFSSGMGPETSSPQVESQNATQSDSQEKEPVKYFFLEKYARLGVKGNFMPLAAQPKNVDIGEWLAHQGRKEPSCPTSECELTSFSNGELPSLLSIAPMHSGNRCQYWPCNLQSERLSSHVCWPVRCMVSSKYLMLNQSRSHTYTWLNNEKVPIKVPACQYISLVQRWIVGKMNDSKSFPTDNITGSSTAYPSGGLNTTHANTPIAAGPTTLNAPLSTLAGRDWVGKSAGFPEAFFGDVKTCFRQIFRLYAHLYHSHWVDPFWHMTNGTNSNGWTDLNSCFVHFITVAKLFGLLSEKDMEPMQPLIDIWVANGSIPADAAKGACAITQ